MSDFKIPPNGTLDNFHGTDGIEYWNALITGNQQAFSKIYEIYFKILFNYGYKICGDKGMVEDAIHDLFVDLWRYKHNLSPTTSVKFYLFRSLRRRLATLHPDVLFCSNDELALKEVFKLASPSKEFEIIESETRVNRVNHLKKFMKELSPRQYEVLILFFYDEFRYEEIADIMNMKAQSVRNLIQRGLLQLKQYMKYTIFFMLLLFL